MGCLQSKIKKPGEQNNADKKNKNKKDRDKDKEKDELANKEKKDNENEVPAGDKDEQGVEKPLDVPVPKIGAAEQEKREASVPKQLAAEAVEAAAETRTGERKASVPFSSTPLRRTTDIVEPSAERPVTSYWYSESDASSTSSSVPQLFRMSPTERGDKPEGTWHWWYEQVRRDRVTRDGASRTRLQDMPNRLARQHEEEPTEVDMDLGHCYMERTAPYVLAGLFTSVHLAEIRWVTSISLDGNYFTNAGLGHMLSTMSAANEAKPLLPSLEQLYLNNMNLDATSVSGILFFLFPVDSIASKRFSAREPHICNDFEPKGETDPRAELFPSLRILSLSDNPGLGVRGFSVVLTHLLSCHHHVHELDSLDLSRCGIPKECTKKLRAFLKDLESTIGEGVYPVIPRRLVLIGNALDAIKASNSSAQVQIVM